VNLSGFQVVISVGSSDQARRLEWSNGPAIAPLTRGHLVLSSQRLDRMRSPAVSTQSPEIYDVSTLRGAVLSSPLRLGRQISTHVHTLFTWYLKLHDLPRVTVCLVCTEPS
jgi:hypothetical protein